MRKLLSLSLFPALLGCPPAQGYHVNLTVTVPSEVQAKFSSANPGLLMGNERTILAELCDPSDVPFSFPFTMWIAGKQCDEWRAKGFETMFVVRLSNSDVAWFNASQAKLQCGQTRTITDTETIDITTQRAIQNGWGPAGVTTIASGVGGACDNAGSYNGTVVLKLSP
jgi:hypothetical protein